MKIEKLPSGTYRIRKMYKGKTYSLLFDHRPVKMEILDEFKRQIGQVDSGTFKECATSYLKVKSNVLSVATVKGYSSLLRNAIPDSFLDAPINEISQSDIQIVINDYASNHAPKTVHNLHGFISAVFGMFRPDMNIHTTLPQKRKFDSYLPTVQDISNILEACKNDKFCHVAIQLGCLGMRRSEILALEYPNDLNGNILTINKAMVEDSDNNWIIKSTKTTQSEREIYLPDSLVAEIHEQGYFYRGYPNTILLSLNTYQDRLGIPRFRFHDLRHFYASYCHANHIPDAVIQKSGGWSSNSTLKRIYTHAMKDQLAESQKSIADSIFS